METEYEFTIEYPEEDVTFILNDHELDQFIGQYDKEKIRVRTVACSDWSLYDPNSITALNPPEKE